MSIPNTQPPTKIEVSLDNGATWHELDVHLKAHDYLIPGSETYERYKKTQRVWDSWKGKY
jgi:hypothetical protein